MDAATRFGPFPVSKRPFEMLHHYIVVRRDMPIGVVLAQVAHAAGESFYTFALRNPDIRTARCANYYPVFQRSSDAEHRTFSPGVATSQVAAGANLGEFDPTRTVVVVLGARNENKLKRLALQLVYEDIPHVLIREVDGVYAGELTAIGIEPAFKSSIAPLLKDFHMFPDVPDGILRDHGHGESDLT